jgi:uncharacterized protein (TIGR03437 family)
MVSPFPTTIQRFEVGRISVADVDGKRVRVRFIGVTLGIDPNEEPRIDHPANFLMLNRTEFTTPDVVAFMINPFATAVNTPGIRIVFETVDEQPPRRGFNIVSEVSAGNVRPVIQSVANTFSQQPAISPGSLITIYSPYLSRATLTGQYGLLSLYPTDLKQYNVRINGVPVPLLSVAADRIEAIAPFAIAGSKSAEVILTVPRNRGDLSGGNVSLPFTVPVLETTPAIRALSQTGTGQIDARQIVKGVWTWSYNSAENPAPRGAAIEIFVTGGGLWAQPLNGDIAYGDPRPRPITTQSEPLAFTGQPISLTIGGVPAEILYAGATLLRPWGLLQINATIPNDAGSGPQPVVLKIGGNDNAAQRSIIHVE